MPTRYGTIYGNLFQKGGGTSPHDSGLVPGKHQRGIPLWSRRLTQKDRVTYRVAQDVVEVLVLTCLGHYDDK